MFTAGSLDNDDDAVLDDDVGLLDDGDDFVCAVLLLVGLALCLVPGATTYTCGTFAFFTLRLRSQTTPWSSLPPTKAMPGESMGCRKNGLLMMLICSPR